MSRMLVLALVAFGCHGTPSLSDDDRAVVDAYMPKARALAMANAEHCAAAVPAGESPHPARGGELDRDPRVRDVVVSCWRDGKVWQFLGNELKLGPRLKSSPPNAPMVAMNSKRRFFLSGEFAEGQVAPADRTSEYVDLPAGDHPLPFRRLVVERPTPDNGFIEVEVTVSP